MREQIVPVIDRYGRLWRLPPAALCPECGQPDDDRTCNHEPLTDKQAANRGALTSEDLAA